MANDLTSCKIRSCHSGAAEDSILPGSDASATGTKLLTLLYSFIFAAKRSSCIVQWGIHNTRGMLDDEESQKDLSKHLSSSLLWTVNPEYSVPRRLFEPDDKGNKIFPVSVTVP
jgi:hypothetical protein